MRYSPHTRRSRIARDDWHLCDLDTPSSAGGRGLSRSTVYAANGTLIATVMQEAMIGMSRDRRTPAPK